MPSPSRHLDLDDVDDFVRRRDFACEPPRRVGVELEWLTVPSQDRTGRVDPAPLAQALGAAGQLPGGSSLTFEPGGQLELSSPPHRRISDACAASAADLAAARDASTRAGVELVGLGADPLRAPQRVVHTPRYDAMERYFDAGGPAGRRMMCNTAAVQVNVGLGPGPDEAATQWRLAHLLGPTLVAAFANSPLLEGRPSGFRSTRMATWWAIDHTRTAPVDSAPPGPDAWVAYVLDARVMLVRADADRCVPLTSPLPFGRWVTQGHELGWPTYDDVEYHLSTLFPPVRPRGWLELRMVDCLPDPWWRVPVAVAAALLADPEAAETAERAIVTSGAAGQWVPAARTGLAHPVLAASAVTCFDAALDALGRGSGDDALVTTVADYADRWTRRGRSPADDRLDDWADEGLVLAGADPKELTSWT